LPNLCVDFTEKGRDMRAIIITGLAFLLVGCGQYGELYLPDSQEKSATKEKKQEQKAWVKQTNSSALH
jgi:predicted small lipoprotein YifL